MAAEGRETVPEAVKTDDRVAALKSLRDLLAEEVERDSEYGFCVECRRSSSTLPQLVRRLESVLEQLDELGVGAAPEKETPLARLYAIEAGTGTEG